MGDTRKCIVEVIEVTSIDRNGEEVLSEIMSHGAEFIASAEEPFTASDLPGELDGESRLVLIRRLVREGFLVTQSDST